MRRGSLAVLASAAAVGGASIFGGATAPPAGAVLPACAIGDLVPVLSDTTVSQGAEYARLVRNKDTLARFYLKNPTTCTLARGQSITPTSATLTVASGGATYTVGSTYNALSGTLTSSEQLNAGSDPLFLVPASWINPCLVDTNAAACPELGSFAPALTATIKYSRKSGTTTQSGLTAFATTPIIEAKTNALRVLVIPMGNTGQSYASQFSSPAQTAVQNGITALSRMYPVAGGTCAVANCQTPPTGDLTGLGGIRYTINLAGMLNLAAVAGAYTTVSGATKFCGTQSNFNAIKAELAQFLQSWNSQNPAATADRVLGVVDEAISFGGEAGCAEGMAAVSSPEAWARAIPDKTVQGQLQKSMTGALFGMELTHTWGLTHTASYHSPSTTAGGSPARAFNIWTRSFLANDHSVMRLDSSTSPWNEDTTLLETGDFGEILCILGGALQGLCGVSGIAGTVQGVPAQTNFVISFTTDGAADAVPAGNGPHTNVVESYYKANVAQTPDDPASTVRLLQLDAAGNVIMPGGNLGVPLSKANSLHDAIAHGDDTTVWLGTGAFAGIGADKIELWKFPTANGTRSDPGAVLLYSRTRQATPPEILSLQRTAGAVSPGDSKTFTESPATPVIPPRVDVFLIEDESGSFADDIQNLQTLAGANGSLITALNGTGSDYATGVAGFRDFPRNGWGDPGDWVYRRLTDITAGSGGFTSGVGTLSANGGNDGPEAQLEAIHYAINPSHAAIDANGDVDTIDAEDTPMGRQPSWRSGAKRVLLLATDASCHVAGDSASPAFPSGWPGDVASATAVGQAAAAASITIIGLVPGGAGTNGCVDTLAAQTGGTVRATNADGSAVKDAIMAGLQNLPVTVTAQVSSCTAGLSLTVSPTSQSVTSGTTAGPFTETLTVATGASPGSKSCTVEYRIGTQVILSRTRTVQVEAPNERLLSLSVTSPVASLLRADIFFRCTVGGANFPAQVGVPPDLVNGAVALWSERIDTGRACGAGGGNGEVFALVTDGITQVGTGDPDAITTVPSAPKLPVPAIYLPGAGEVANDATIVLVGSGKDAENGELSPTSLTWTIVKPDGSTLAAGSGRVVDAPPPGLWPLGAYTARLEVTDGTNTVSATRAFTVVDGTRPSLTVTHVSSANGTNTNRPVEVSVSASDNALASVSCEVDDAPVALTPAGSPLAAGATSFGGTLTVTAFGRHVVDCRAADVAGNVADEGNTAGATDLVHIVYVFEGFFQPIRNPATINLGRAGRTYPLKWRLRDGAAGPLVTETSTVTGITSRRTSCASGETVAVELSGSSGNSVLRWDAVALQFVYDHQTSSTPGCYTVELSLNDDTTHTALFDLR